MFVFVFVIIVVFCDLAIIVKGDGIHKPTTELSNDIYNVSFWFLTIMTIQNTLKTRDNTIDMKNDANFIIFSLSIYICICYYIFICLRPFMGGESLNELPL